MSLRPVILGPITTAPLRPHLPDLPADAPRGMGGSNIVNLVLARLARGLATDLITVDPSASAEIQRHEGPLLRLWIVRRRAARALRNLFREEVRLLHRALEESRAEICHANWTFEYGLAAVTQKKIPHLVSVHDHAGNMMRHIGWRYLPHYFISRRVIARARSLSAVSPYIAAYLHLLTGRETPVVPNLLSQLVWDRAQKKSSEISNPRFVSVLTWASFRKPVTALRAFAKVRHEIPDATYTMLGPGFETGGPAESWARENGCAENVTFAGTVPYVQALDHIASASALIHPSLEEALPSPVAEAMALRVPVIAAREAGGSRWLLEEGRHGNLFNGRDADELAQLICALVSQAAQTRDESVAGAFNRIRQLCSPEKILADYDRLYANLRN